ncbi:hypothetical protein MMC07_003322 [Pseudocyphellaria aurata]|nr:hypothetical protein [Pseudocyphellaria aurata]
MIEILSETESRKLSQNFGTLIPKNGASLDPTIFQRLERTHRQIIRTVSSAQLSPTHATASWNCLCALLELSITSSDLSVRKIGFSSETWVEVFRIFLLRSPNIKAKSSKQVLLTLTKLLSKQPIKAVQQCLIEYVIDSVVMMIYEQQDYSSVKPAFQVLDHFLVRDIVEYSDIVAQMARSKAQREGLQKGPGHTKSSSEGLHIRESFDLSLDEVVLLIEAFTSQVLNWSKYPDLAPLVGRLLASFFKSVRGLQTKSGDTKRFKYKLPLWLTPIKEAIQKELLVLEICETHILPSLLALDTTETAAFIDTLPVKDLREGNTESHTVIDIELCLSTLKICADSRKCTTTIGTRECDEDSPQYVAYGLLAHPSSTVRVTALSLFTNNFSHTSPMSIQNLSYLEQYIPFFHGEVNPKVRGEFISQMSRFCEKLRRGFSVVCKLQESMSIQASVCNDEVSKIKVDEFRTTGQLLENLRSFSNWYVGFLIEQLQPTASYQRHITALKMLESMIEVGISRSDPRRLFNPADIVDDDYNSNKKQFFGSRCVRLLLDLVMDPFDDVRSVASSLLKTILWNMHPWNTEFRAGFTSPFMESSLSKFEAMARTTYNDFVLLATRQADIMMCLTGRADHADGVGRLYSLLHDSCDNLGTPVAWSDNRWSIVIHVLSGLENDIKIARKDIHIAVKSAPLHGKLIAMRHIVSSKGFYDSSDFSDHAWTARTITNKRILDCCAEIWEAVRATLCFDSPEGYDTEEGEIDDPGIGTKDTLSFCWRALKESSLLMNVMVTSNPYNAPDSNRGFRYEDFRQLGNLTFLQLSELRHRGAFSAVSQTFSACCKRCAQAHKSDERHMKDSLIPHLPKKWYQDILRIIDDKSSALTRRSAGIPAIITGILSASPSGEFFDEVILDLQAIADLPLKTFEHFENLRLPQVHALNCLKDIFTDALLGPASEPHVAVTLEIAAGCLESDLWAMRNCGLMLFKALIRRLNGGTDTASTKASSSHRSLSKLAYEKYPNLPNIILRLLYQTPEKPLNASVDGIETLSLSLQAQWVFPALEILERSGFPLQHRIDIEEAVRRHMASPIWAIREKAAKTLALVTNDEDLNAEIRTLLKPSNISQNCLHGRLLCVRSMISRIGQKTTDERDALLQLLLDSFELFVTKNECPITAAAYLNTTADGLERLIQCESHAANKYALRLEAHLPYLSRDIHLSFNHLLSSRSSALFAEALARCLNLMDIADGPPSSLTSTFPSTLPRRELNESLPVEQKSEIITKTSASLHNIDLMAPKDLTSERIARNDSGTTARLIHSAGATGFTTNSYGIESSLFSTKLPELPANTCWPSQANPQQHDDHLRLFGKDLASVYKDQFGHLKAREAIAAWICELSLAGEEKSDAATRFAAAESATEFITGLRKLEFDSWAATELLGGYLCIYDILFDDDEDVRDQGAIAATTLLSAAESTNRSRNSGSVSLMPSAAGSKLLQFIMTEYQDSDILWIDGVRRLTGAISLFRLGPVEVSSNLEKSTDSTRNYFIPKTRISLDLRSSRNMLQEARRQDTALFVEEKANLFVDPVKEAKKWADVLVELRPSSLEDEMVSELGAWSIEGLAALIEIAESREDGPLGWTTKPDVFALGMRIILAAKVRVRLSSLQRNEGQSSICLELLRKLHLVGKEKFLHGLWLRQIEEIVGKIPS